jgi:predicted nuclease with TOPRIM domain
VPAAMPDGERRQGAAWRIRTWPRLEGRGYVGIMDDAQLQAHFAAIDERFDRLTAMMASQFEAMQAHFDRRMDALEGRMDALERRVDAMDLKFEEKFIGVYERLASARLAQERFERRVLDRLDAMAQEIAANRDAIHGLREDDARLREDLAALRDGIARLDERVSGVEVSLLGLNDRLDGLSEDMRQRFRTVNDRLAALAA